MHHYRHEEYLDVLLVLAPEACIPADPAPVDPRRGTRGLPAAWARSHASPATRQAHSRTCAAALLETDDQDRQSARAWQFTKNQVGTGDCGGNAAHSDISVGSKSNLARLA